MWYTASDAGSMYGLWRSTLDGRERRIFSAPAALVLFDVAKDGRALMARYDRTAQVNGWFAGEPGERDVSWRDFSFGRDLSADGRRFLLTDFGEGSGPNYTVYLRKSTDLAGGAPLEVKGLEPDEMPTGWTSDGRGLLVMEGGNPSRRVVRVDPDSGRREPFKDVHPSDPGLIGPSEIILTPDGRSYLANYNRVQMTLFLAEGLKE